MLTGTDKLTVEAVEAELAALDAAQAKSIAEITRHYRDEASRERADVRRTFTAQRKEYEVLLAVLRREAGEGE